MFLVQKEGDSEIEPGVKSPIFHSKPKPWLSPLSQLAHWQNKCFEVLWKFGFLLNEKVP
jgi:hypothetical protein